MAASRLLGAAAACVILLSFAAEDRKSYWNGCIKAAKVICQQIFPILAFIIFLLKPFKKCFKIVFLSLWRRDPVLKLQIVVYWEGLCASFVVQSSTGEYFVQVLWYKVVLGSNFCKLCSAK